jgi:hypothetical protein
MTSEDSRETQSSAGLPEGRVFELLANDRRRRVIRRVAAGGETRLDGLAEAVASAEADAESADGRYKSVYVSLRQSHLPRLDDADVVDFDDEANVVRPGPNLPAVRTPTAAVAGRRRTPAVCPIVAVALGLVGLAVTAGAHFRAPGLALVDPLSLAATACCCLLVVGTVGLLADPSARPLGE